MIRLPAARLALVAGLALAALPTLGAAQPVPHGTLTVTSEPTGAHVTLTDGTRLGQTPVTARVAAGPVRLTVTLDGYEAWTGETVVPAERETALSAVLAPTAGGLRVRGDGFGGPVRVNGKVVERDDLVLVPVGVAEVEVQVDGRDRTLRVPIERGRETRLSVVDGPHPLALAAAVVVPGAPQWASGRAVLGVPLTLAAAGGVAAAVAGAADRAEARAEFESLRDAYRRAQTEDEAVRLRDAAGDQATAANRAGTVFAVGTSVALVAVAVSATDAYRQYRRRTVRVTRGRLSLAPAPAPAGVAVRLSL